MSFFVSSRLDMLNALMIFKDDKWQIDTVGDDFDSPRGNFGSLDDAFNALINAGSTGDLAARFDGFLQVLLPNIILDLQWDLQINDDVTQFNITPGDLVEQSYNDPGSPFEVAIRITNNSTEDSIEVTGAEEVSDESDGFTITGGASQVIAPEATGEVLLELSNNPDTYVAEFKITISGNEFSILLSIEVTGGGGGR